jgi:phosphoglycerate kinase
MKFIRNTSIKNKTVLLRLDLNEPLDDRGKLADDFRIRASLPSIKKLHQQGNKVIVASHLGRPVGKIVAALSLRPVAQRLAELLGYKFVETDHQLPHYRVNHLIFFHGDIRKQHTQLQLQQLVAHNIVLLENLRFYAGEEENDPVFAKHLASLAEVYVNDAFAVSHRKVASIVAVTKYLPSYAGLELEQEIKALSHVLTKPKKPVVLLMGGIKITDKVKTIEYLAKQADKILVGGGLANLFFLARGYEIGLSKVEKEAVRLAWQIDKNLKRKLLLPQDVVVADKDMTARSIHVVPSHLVRAREAIYDIGPESILSFAHELGQAKTIVWNGPLGFFEKKAFATSTMALARVIGGVGRGRGYALAGGGETVDAIRLAHQETHMDHLSTGGGAMLEFLAGEKLPGIKALEQ